MDLLKFTDRYEKLRADRKINADKFISGERPYMIFQTGEGNVWGDIRSKEQSFEENVRYIKSCFGVKSDHLPVMEPWFGTGVYANMYGCDYVWRDGSAPAVHYKYKSVDEIEGLKKPDWHKAEIPNLILDTIRYFKSKTGDAIPIIHTDTQSASDTATLILDACEVFMACLDESEAIMKFMEDINSLVIEFSTVQSEIIGNALVKPGHIMLNADGFKGFSVSDDNLAVASPTVNRMFNLPLDQKIGEAMGGVAIHSCGKWSHTMPFVKELVPSCAAIDCAIDSTVDPNPNEPEAVRDALAGKGIYAHVRMTGETDKMLEIVKRVLHPDLKLIVHPAYIDDETAARNYYELENLLGSFYKSR
ncbi:MAG: methylcobalamin:coenzyme M methyltransferase [Firmicutes bacterium ADurb.Bin193]|nr:MAG: methylcobalamin:coenzyme M methyltransferase [Firmicutes bacterium ADurb.Bin193]